MKTDCRQGELEFQGLDSRRVCADFSGGAVTSDAGALLLREVDFRTGLIDKFAACFTDSRDARYVKHDLGTLLRQRVMAIALGHEDLSDHDELRDDPLMSLAAGRAKMDRGAGKSTLQRAEGFLADSRYHKLAFDPGAADRFLIEYFLDSHTAPPPVIDIDLDASDAPTHGDQELNFFNAYYGHYCYLPLYITCGDHILCVRLLPSNQDPGKAWEAEAPRIVEQIRKRWPQATIRLRGDCGFMRDPLMKWCEENNVFYVLGMPKNQRLVKVIGKEMEEAKRLHGERREASRVFGDFAYQTQKSWSAARRVVAKAEHLDKGANPRFVVTNLPADQFPAKELYEKIYCARGAMENRIKEHQADLFGDRLSGTQAAPNQLRLYLSTVAYTLIATLRRCALPGTALERAQSGTIRRKLLKIGARITVSARRVFLSMSGGYPHKELFALVLSNLNQLALVPARARAGPL